MPRKKNILLKPNKMFCFKLEPATRKRIEAYVPGYFHSMSELIRAAAWESLAAGITGPETTVIKDMERAAIVLQVPADTFIMVTDAVFRTNSIKYTASFFRLAIIRYLRILDLLTGEKK